MYQSDLILSGIKVPAGYTVTLVSTGSDYAIWTVSASATQSVPIGDDSLSLTLKGTGTLPIVDTWGNPLGGGTDYNRSFAVLPGDVNDNGYVQSVDGLLALGAFGNAAGQGNYTIFEDVDGDGTIDQNDINSIHANLGTVLPT